MNFKGLNVGQFMDKLAKMDPDEPVKYDFVHFRPTTLESYRGYYEDAALGYSRDDDHPKVGQLLAHFEQTLGKVFHGWKGGNGSPITRETSLWVANPGESGDTVIVDVQMHTFVTIITRSEEETDVQDC